MIRKKSYCMIRSLENKGKKPILRALWKAVRMEKCKIRKKPVKRKRERDEQMEWVGTILVHDGIISKWLQYVTAEMCFTYIPL